MTTNDAAELGSRRERRAAEALRSVVMPQHDRQIIGLREQRDPVQVLTIKLKSGYSNNRGRCLMPSLNRHAGVDLHLVHPDP